jgi:hypothetical protein
MVLAAAGLLGLGVVCSLATLGDEPYDMDGARQAVSKAFGVPTDAVTGEWEGTPLHVRCFGFHVAAEGYTADVYVAPEWHRIVQATFTYADDYAPDPSWSDLKPEEAFTEHLRRLGMSVPAGVRLADTSESQLGESAACYLRYQRDEGAGVAPLWLDGRLDAQDKRPWRLTSLDYPAAVDLTPTISREAAVQAATDQVAEGNRGETEVRLRAWFRPDETQVLWWDIRVHEGDAKSCGTAFLIDAHTGAVDHRLTF